MLITLAKMRKDGQPGKAPDKKVCKTCGIEKPIAQFKKHVTYADGHANQCRQCEYEKQARKQEEEAGNGFFVHAKDAFIGCAILFISLAGRAQDVHPINRILPPIDRMPYWYDQGINSPFRIIDTLVTKPDTLRATLLVTYNGANMSIAHTKPGYVLRIGNRDIDFLDDRRKPIKAPVEVWNYKVRP